MNPGALHFESTLDNSSFDAGIRNIQRGITRASDTAKKEASGMDSSFRNLGAAIGGYFSAQALFGFVKELINVRGEFQKTEVAFTTMLGSGEKAKVLMGQMVELAASTPFSLQEVSTGAKQLLAFQVPANQVVDTLTRMGNIAAGLGVPLSRINLVYGQVKAKGKLAGDDLRQFTEAGIPMLAELAKKFDTSTGAITEMVTAGKIGFKDVEDVLFSMTDEGGMFFDLMKKQSKTLSGQISNLGDTIDQTLNKLGEANDGLLSGGISAITYLIENYESLAEIIGVIVTAYGVYRAALVATVIMQRLAETAAYQNALALGTLTTTQAYAAAATIELQVAQRGLNATMMANPIGIVIGLLAALSYVIYKNVSATSALEDIQTRMAEDAKKYNDSISEQKSGIENLITVIKNKNTTDEISAKALNKLNLLTNNRIKGLTVENIRIGKSTSAIGEYIKALEREAEAKVLIQSKIDARKDIENVDRDNPDNLTLGERFGNFDDASDFSKSPRERKIEQMILKKQAAKKQIIDADNKLRKLANQGVDITGGTSTDIDSVEKEISSSTKSIKKENTAHKRELAEIYSKGSLADLDQRISLWNEALQKASGDEIDILVKDKFGDVKKSGNSVNRDTALAELEILEKAKKDREKKIRNISFEEEIDELERQWAVKNKMAEKYGSDYAQSAYPELKDSFFEDITNQFKVFDDIVKSGGTLSEDQISKWTKLSDILNTLGGEKSRSEKVIKDLSLIKESVNSTYEYLDKVKEEQKKNEGDNSFEGLKIKSFLKEEENATLESIRSSYLVFLKEHQSYEDQRIEISKRYALLRQQISNDDTLSPIKKNEALKAANEAEGQEISTLFLKGMKENPEWAKAFEDMGNVSLSQLKKLRSNLSTELSRLITSGQGTPEQLKALRDIIKEIDSTVLTRNPFKALAEAIKSLGDESDTTKTKLEKIKKVAESVSASANLTNQQISTGLEIAEALGIQFSEETKGIIQDVQTTIGGIEDIAAGIASNNPVQILKGIGGVVKGMAGLFNGDKKKEKNIKAWAEEVENLKFQYEQLQRAIEKALGEDSYKQQQAAINNLRQQQAYLSRMIAEERDKKSSDDGKISEWQNQIISINNQIGDIYENMANQIAQTNFKDLATQLSDALVEAYLTGEDAATAYGKVANDVMKNAVKNALKMQLLEKPMQDVINQLIKNMGFGADGSGSFDGLTDSERQQIRDLMAQASQNYMNALSAAGELFDGGLLNNVAVEGAIKGVSEETASILAGQLNAIRNNQGEMLTISQESILVFRASYLQLVQIEYNTRYLKYIYKQLGGVDIDRLRASGT